ncbi:hypothetical protein T12_12366 [Trichinella patagoniensis]|uniref:Uncharacterized protein n=1 Tax=Trichinella patagoniensis TaxID=990121 RepID=A0A0V0Z6H7_9BILA|nr:hypothetical protein T12_12366 [Trichinella patagoniensis]
MIHPGPPIQNPFTMLQLFTIPSISLYQRYTLNTPISHQFRVQYLPTTLRPPTQSCEPYRHSLHQSFGHPYPPTPVHHPSISLYLPSTHSTSDSTIYTLPASILSGIPPPTTHQAKIQSCVPERQPLSQSYSVAFPPAHSTSSINSSVPATHSTKLIQSAIPLPANPTYIYTDSFSHHSDPHHSRNNSLYTCSTQFHRIMRVESTPTTHPPLTQCCVPHLQCFHYSFGLPLPLATCLIPLIGVYGCPSHPTFILNDVPSYHTNCYCLIAACPTHTSQAPILSYIIGHHISIA